MTEARARGVSGTAEAEGICASVTEALSAVLQSDASPVERCAALEALIWAQVIIYPHHVIVKACNSLQKNTARGDVLVVFLLQYQHFIWLYILPTSEPVLCCSAETGSSAQQHCTPHQRIRRRGSLCEPVVW